jgi:hypothetical protein
LWDDTIPRTTAPARIAIGRWHICPTLTIAIAVTIGMMLDFEHPVTIVGLEDIGKPFHQLSPIIRIETLDALLD